MSLDLSNGTSIADFAQHVLVEFINIIIS